MGCQNHTSCPMSLLTLCSVLFRELVCAFCARIWAEGTVSYLPVFSRIICFHFLYPLKQSLIPYLMKISLPCLKTHIPSSFAREEQSFIARVRSRHAHGHLSWERKIQVKSWRRGLHTKNNYRDLANL